MKTLSEWLAHCERLHPKIIDMTLSRVAVVRDRLGIRFDCPVITVAGTNGKGSTCSMLESIARQAAYRVGLYIKPHLVNFEERCRIDGRPAEAETLLAHFEAVEAARGDLTLTYFEFTTLVIMRRLQQEPLDLVILEVGLGGRLDAVNVIDADVAIITSIDLDHTEYLGNDREAIGREKAGVLRAGRVAVCADPAPPESIAQEAARVGAELRSVGRDFVFGGDRQQWHWRGRTRRYSGLAYPALRGANQLINAAGALAAFEALHDRLPINAQAVRSGLALVELPGRFQVLPGQPTVVLDVAHNPHAVATLAQNLEQLGFSAHTHAVFGAMGDKALDAILGRMAPVVDTWHFCDLPTPRAVSASALALRWRSLQSAGQITPPSGAEVYTHASPWTAFQQVRGASKPADRIVVFGSFFTVGGVMAGLQGNLPTGASAT